MNIGKYISELLYNHNCVIIPGLGGLVANYSSSYIHPTQNVFYPPSKKIAFNKNLSENDGLLVNYIANNENISYDIVNEIINNYVKNIKETINENNTYTIENIGSFSLNIEKSIQFIPDNKINYLIDSYGLQSFQVNPILRNNKQEQEELKINYPSIYNSTKSSYGVENKQISSSKFIVYALAACLALLVIFNRETVGDVYLNQTTLSPTSCVLLSQYKQRNNNNITEEVVAEYDSLENYINNIKVYDNSKKIEADTLINKEEIKAEKVEVKPENKIEITEVIPKYNIIQSGFRSIEKADKQLDVLKNKGYNAYIVKQNKSKFTLISIGGYDDINLAFEQLKIIKSKDYNNAWLFVN